MGKYIKKFKSLLEAEKIKYTEKYNEPYVYNITGESSIYYQGSNYLVVKIDTSLLSNDSDTLWTTYNGDIFDDILIDDIKWDTPMTPATKTDIEVGKHIIKIKFKDNTKIGSDTNSAPMFLKSHVTEIFIPNNFKIICCNVFMDCTSLNNVKIPDSITLIKCNAFRGCSSLNKVIFPHSGVKFESSAFSNTSLEEIYINFNLEYSLHGYVNTPKIKKVIVGPDVTKLPSGFVSSFSNLKTVEIRSNQITHLPISAFSGCSSLSEINIPDSVITYDPSSFSTCISLGYVKDGIRYFKLNDKLGSIITNIEDYTLEHYTLDSNLKNLNFGFNKTSFENIKSITLPNSLEKISAEFKDNIFTYLTFEQIRKIVNINPFAVSSEYFKYIYEYLNLETSENQYFFISCKDGQNNVSPPLTIRVLGNSTDDLYYSSDLGNTWTQLHVKTDDEIQHLGPTIVGLPANSKPILFKGNISQAGDSIVIDEINGADSLTINGGTYKFKFGCDVIIGGNIMSLVYGDEFKGKTSLSENSSIFGGIFSSNNNEIDASKLVLPATDLSSCCYEAMFCFDKKLTSAPELPATTLAEACYKNMFQGCVLLTAAPELPATTLAPSCYEQMFKGCTSLQKSPSLVAILLQNACYKNMFRDCTSLNDVTLYGNIDSSYAYNWLDNVASSGIIYTPSSLTISDLPNGWETKEIPAYWYIDTYNSNTFVLSNFEKENQENVNYGWGWHKISSNFSQYTIDNTVYDSNRDGSFNLMAEESYVREYYVITPKELTIINLINNNNKFNETDIIDNITYRGISYNVYKSIGFRFNTKIYYKEN